LLSTLGVACYGLDNHGFGRSTAEYAHKCGAAPATLARSLRARLCCFGRRAFAPSFPALAEDAAWYIRACAARHPGAPVFALGESMGGALALEASARLPAGALAGLLLIAPMVGLGSAVAPPRWLELVGRGLALAAPLLPAPSLKDLTDATFRDPEKRAEVRRDGLRWQQRVRLGTAFALKDAAAAVAAGVARFPPTPLLLLHGTRDVVCPLSGSEGLLAGAAAPDKCLIVYEGAWHALFTEPVDTRRAVFLDIAAWLRARAPGLGAGGAGWWAEEDAAAAARGGAGAAAGSGAAAAAAAAAALSPAAVAAAVAAGGPGLRVQRKEGSGPFKDDSIWSAAKDPFRFEVGQEDPLL